MEVLVRIRSTIRDTSMKEDAENTKTIFTRYIVSSDRLDIFQIVYVYNLNITDL